MSGPTDQRPPRRRALPTVSDVVRELRGTTTVEPELLFKAARQVCAEELNRAKQGFEPAPMEILVKRARRMLGVAEDLPPTSRIENAASMAAAAAPPPPPRAGPSIAFVFEPEPAPPAPAAGSSPIALPGPVATPPPPAPGPAAPTPRFVLSTAEEPFLETTGSIDLKPIWAKKVSLLDEPLAPIGEPFPAAPAASAPLEGPTMALPLGGIDLLTPAPPSPPAAPDPFPAEAPFSDAPAVEGGHGLEPLLPEPEPGDVAEPAEAAKDAEPPKPAPEPLSTEPLPALAPTEALPPVLVPVVPTEPTSILFSEGPGDDTIDRLKVEAASVKLEEVMPAFEAASKPHEPEPAPAPLEVRASIPRPEIRPAPAEPVRWGDVEPEASSLFSPSAPEPARSRWPLAAAVLVIVGGAVAGWYFLRSRESVSPPAPVTRARPTRAPAGDGAATVSTPPAVATSVPAVAPTAAPAPPTAAPAAAPTSAPPTPVPATPVPTRRAEGGPSPTVVRTQTPAGPQSRAATITTPDWAGREPVFAIHFSSYKDRDKAEKDAARLAKSFDRPGHAVGIDLGEKGVWYRVMIGEFATGEEALAYRAELEQKGTPNMGFVYRLVGKTP